MIDEIRFTTWLRTSPPGSKITVFEGKSGMAPGWFRRYHENERIFIAHEHLGRTRSGENRYALEVTKISEQTQRILEELRYGDDIHNPETWR